MPLHVTSYRFKAFSTVDTIINVYFLMSDKAGMMFDDFVAYITCESIPLVNIAHMHLQVSFTAEAGTTLSTINLKYFM